MSLDSGGKLGEPCRHGETSENNSHSVQPECESNKRPKVVKKTKTKTRPLISTHDHKLAALHTFAWLISFCPPRPLGGGTVYGPSVRSHSCPGVALRAPACAAATLETAGDVSGPHEELIFLSLLFGQAHPLVVTTLSQSFNCSQYDRGQTLSAWQSPHPPSVYLKSPDGRGYGPSDDLSMYVCLCEHGTVIMSNQSIFSVWGINQAFAQ